MRILLTIVLLFFTAFNDKAREGNRAYERGDYETAAKLYMDALQEEPNNARLYFNLGNALAKMGKPTEAAAAWDQFKELNQSPLEKSKAVYNQGNTAAEQKEWDKALNSYREALKLNPSDLDAKHNYEMAVKQKQEQEQEQEQKQEQKQDQNKDQDQQQQQKQDQNQDQQQQQQNQDQNQGQEQQQKQQPKFDPGSMTKEQARDMLNALESQEKDLLKDLKKQKAPSSYRNAKDW